MEYLHVLRPKHPDSFPPPPGTTRPSNVFDQPLETRRSSTSRRNSEGPGGESADSDVSLPEDSHEEKSRRVSIGSEEGGEEEVQPKLDGG